MASTTLTLTQAKAVASKLTFSVKMLTKVLLVLITVYYGTLLDFLSGTKED
jgi:hypothetical protein